MLYQLLLISSDVPIIMSLGMQTVMSKLWIIIKYIVVFLYDI